MFPPARAVELMHHALLVFWHTTRWDRDAASVLLAVSPGVATTVAEFGLRDIRHIAEYQYRQLRPRWEYRPQFWRHLLTAARSGDSDAIHALHLHGLQLLGTSSLYHHPDTSSLENR
jgi:hypothetical protein